MKTPLVYLAGPIAGTLYAGCTTWRRLAARLLADRDIETLSPMRAKGALRGKQIGANFEDYSNNGPFYTSRGIMTRDRNDVMRCDALLVNLLGAQTPSLGTVMELAWADMLRKPCVVAIEAEGNPHDNHPMVHEAIGFRLTELVDAIDAVAIVLGR